MKTFRDNNGLQWQVSLTIGSAKRVRDLLGVNLLAMEERPADGGKDAPTLLARITTDAILICDVVFCLVKPQADAAGVSDEQFGAALGGQAIREATLALHSELLDFFRQAGRADHAMALGRQREMMDKLVPAAEQAIAAISLEDRLAEFRAEASLQTPGGTSTPPPASSESSPTP